MADMQAIYDEEAGLNNGGGLMSLLRGGGEMLLGPEIMDNLPMLLRAMQNTNKDTLTMEQMRDMSGPLDESSLSVQLSNTPGLEESIGPELALMLGMAGGPGGKGKGLGSLFDMLGDSLDPKKIQDSLRRANRDPDAPRSFKDLDIERQQGVYDKELEELESRIYADESLRPGPDEDLDLFGMLVDSFSPRKTTKGREGFDDLVQDMRDEYMDSDEALEKAQQAQRIIMRKARRDGDMMATGGRPGLYANINAKRKRIAAGSGEQMRKKGDKGAPTAANFRQAAKTAKKANGGGLSYKQGYYGKSYK